MICFPAMTGKLIPAITHGQKLSILFALASSRAPALYGEAKMVDGAGGEGLPGRAVRRSGERMGDENESR